MAWVKAVDEVPKPPKPVEVPLVCPNPKPEEAGVFKLKVGAAVLDAPNVPAEPNEL